MANVTQEMFAEGYAVATKALNGDSMPLPAMNAKTLAAGSATSLFAALNPDLGCKSPYTKVFNSTSTGSEAIPVRAFQPLTHESCVDSSQRRLPCRFRNLDRAIA